MNHFYLIIVAIIIFGIVTRFEVKLNILFGCFLIIIYYYQSNEYYTNDQKIEQEISTDKINTIRPPIDLIKKYPALVDLIFSIQDYYVYNPESFEKIIESLEQLIKLYEESIEYPQTANLNYSLIERAKLDALNYLHSIVINLPPLNDKYEYTKMDRALEKLEYLLSIYLEEIKTINQKYLLENNYNCQTKILNDGPKEFNYYGDNPNFYTFEFY